MRIALAQINPTVGDIAGNSEQIARAIDQARQAGADLVVTPELAVIGYPPKDLLLKPDAIDQCLAAVNDLAAQCTGIAAIIGYPCPSDQSTGRLLFNAAAFCQDGKLIRRHVKSLLPTYDVFDETRYFEPGALGQENEIHVYQDIPLGISICEDLWNQPAVVPRQLYHEEPIDHLAKLGAKVLINCSASPFSMDKHAHRLKLFKEAAKRYGMAVVYCNQVGGNDELVFDGNSCVLDANGKLIAQAKSFETDLLLVDISCDEQSMAPGRIESAAAGIDSVYRALVLGLRDYCRKCGFDSAVLGLSGGIDSAVTAAICVDALGADKVRGVTMPSRFSSAGSVDDARDLAQRLGVQFDNVPIAQAHDAFEQMLAPCFEGTEPGVAEENIQARIRGVILMGLSNKFGSLLVTTGNKSELAVGYCTLYGDMAGGLAILSDVPKTLVWQLARWINDDAASPLRQRFGGPVIPDNSITKPPSAELRPDQVDQNTLPPYALLDQIIEMYVELNQSPRQIVDQVEGADAQLVARIIRMIDLNEYKRKQAAPGLKVTGKAFGFGRRMPIAQRYKADKADKPESVLSKP